MGQPTDDAKDRKASASTPFSTPRMVEIEAELERARAELAATVDELTDRLDPRTQAARAAEQGRKVVRDAFGSGVPVADRRRALKAVAVVAAALGVVVVLAARRRR
ncbi:DUF3618 domain-containing protein [Cellulomonas soli]|uniref:DUF3618 domain-containing protein n=1 Tax=Cellulomonas soli TaxID=931535 RepID=A0A512PC80_9CELL|nr:DUF3618 domain-containing protein [Cellulomonas soli]NYI58302.1 hypothetical protein [Cellulomonas soli]GEP68722.1 hypothetical protein CSO01_14370 [Cellulomonas soli]